MKTTQVLFYIATSEKIGPEYIELARQFNGYSIKLVPLRPREFLKVRGGGNRINVIAIVESLRDKSVFEMIYRRLLGFCLKNKLVNLYHITAFGPVPLYRVAFNSIPYMYIKLPVEISELVHTVSEDIWDQSDNFSSPENDKQGFLGQFMQLK